MSDTRYYVGDEYDLENMTTREEIEEVTVEDYDEAEQLVADHVNDVYDMPLLPWQEPNSYHYNPAHAWRELDPIGWRVFVADTVIEVDLDDYPSEEEDDE